MRLYLTLIILCFYSVGYSQDFGCFDDPVNSNRYDGICYRTICYVDYDSLFWIQYNLPKTSDGYYKAMWNKYQVKMEGNIINGKRNGIWKIYLNNRNAFYQGEFIEDRKEGEWKRFEIVGYDTILQFKGSYKNDLEEGEFITYDRDNIIRSILNYRFGKLDGKAIDYSYSHGAIRSKIITNYKDGKKIGTETEYKLDKKGEFYIYRISEYSSDGLSCNSIEFSSEGDTLEIYKNLNGNFDLQIQQFKQIKIGEKLLLSYKEANGTFINIAYNYYKGDTMRIETSDNDKGFGRIYKEDTIDGKRKIDKVINYYNGLTDASYKQYYSNGQLAYEILLKKGSVYTAVSAFSRDGKKLDAGTLKDGNGTLNFYFPDGKLKSSFTYYNSYCKGNVISYYKNGAAQIEGIMYCIKPFEIEFSIYTDDDLNINNLKNNVYGEIRYYHESQSNMSIIKYDSINKITSFKYFYSIGNPSATLSKFNNKKIGVYTSYYENGKLEVEGKYKITKDSSSEKDSIWNYYFMEGNLRASISYKDGEKIGTSKYYDKTGKLRRIEVIEEEGTHYSIFDGDTVNYTDKTGLKQGKWISFPYSFKEGEELCDNVPNNIEYYKDGKPVGVWENTERFYSQKEKYIWKDSTLAYVYGYNKNNQLKEEGEIIYPDLKFGLWKEYDCAGGYLKAEGQYYLSRKIGKWKIYKTNGKVKKIIDYNKN